MFIDASAIVAILTREPEADALADVLESAHSPITSPIAIFEAALGICRKRHASVEEAHEDVREFLGMAGDRTVSVTEREAEIALVHLLDHTVGEILLLGIAAHILERQHRQRRLVRERQRCLLGDQDAVNPHWPRDVCR